MGSVDPFDPTDLQSAASSWEWDDSEPDDGGESYAINLPGDDEPDPPDGDEYPFTKTYLALDGVDPEELTEEMVEDIRHAVLEQAIWEHNLPASDVRVVSKEKNVIEMDTDA